MGRSFIVYTRWRTRDLRNKKGMPEEEKYGWLPLTEKKIGILTDIGIPSGLYISKWIDRKSGHVKKDLRGKVKDLRKARALIIQEINRRKGKL